MTLQIQCFVLWLCSTYLKKYHRMILKSCTVQTFPVCEVENIATYSLNLMFIDLFLANYKILSLIIV